MNLLIFASLSSTLILSLEMFSYQSKNFIKKRVSSDIFLGDSSEKISNNLNLIQNLNERLTTIHNSCPIIMSMPPPGSLKALKAGRLISKKIALSQSALKKQNDFYLQKIKLKKIFVTQIKPSTREKNICAFTGPLKYKQKIILKNTYSGTRINFEHKKYMWAFFHKDSRDLWF